MTDLDSARDGAGSGSDETTNAGRVVETPEKANGGGTRFPREENANAEGPSGTPTGSGAAHARPR